jgi:hypothetical protein
MARMEKQRDKAAKRLERKLARQSGTDTETDIDIDAVDTADAADAPDAPDAAENPEPDESAPPAKQSE